MKPDKVEHKYCENAYLDRHHSVHHNQFLSRHHFEFRPCMCLNKNAILNYRYNFYFDETIQICNIVMILTTTLTASSTVPPSFVSILMSSNAELYIFIFMKHALSIVFQNINVLNYPLLSSILKQT